LLTLIGEQGDYRRDQERQRRGRNHADLREQGQPPIRHGGIMLAGSIVGKMSSTGIEDQLFGDYLRDLLSVQRQDDVQRWQRAALCSPAD
jgi:hypothetical protein